MAKLKLMIAGSANPHIPGYLRSHGSGFFDIVAVSDPDEGRLERDREMLAGLPVKYYSDHLEMFKAHPDADAVIIGSDNIDHLQMFKDAVGHHLHIYMMKVISMNEEECQEMIRIQDSYDRVIQAELELHFRPDATYVRKMFQAGALGRLRSISLSNISQCPCHYFPNWGDPTLSYGRIQPVRPGWKTCRGGALTDHPHPFDLIRFITGREFKAVEAVVARNQRDWLAVEDNITVIGELDDGTPFMINPSYAHLEEAVPTRRLIWPASLECGLKLTTDSKSIMFDFYDRPLFICGEGHQSPNRLMIDGLPETKTQPNNSLLGCFHDCIRGLRDKPETSLRESYAAVRVMNAAYEAAYTGKTVYL